MLLNRSLAVLKLASRAKARSLQRQAPTARHISGRPVPIGQLSLREARNLSLRTGFKAQIRRF